MHITSPHPYANRLAQDVFDALWLEDLYGFRTHCIMRPAADGKTILEISLDDMRLLCWQGQEIDGLRPFRILSSYAVLRTGTQMIDLEIDKIVKILQTADWWIDKTGRFAQLFSLAYKQAAFTALHEHTIMAHFASAPGDLLSWEALSCLKDRPFHPLARAKDWGKSDGHAYAAETMMPLPLRWIAVPKHRIVCAKGRDALTGQPLAENLLDPLQQDMLSKTAHACGADGEEWLWLPVHPWQWDWLNQSTHSRLTGCIDLCTGPGTATPTASLRSLGITGNINTHLKLALSVCTLGAIRTLPPRYLHNGTLASTCLKSLRQRDNWLATHLLLCDEDQWWVVSQREQCHRDKELFSSESGDLACMIRRYPMLPDTTLIPMAALPAVTANGELPAFDYLIGPLAQEKIAWNLFSDIARTLLELGLRCFAQGVMPELHGQNVLLAFRGRQIIALVLRDHDTLRICRPLMQSQGVAIPDYIVDRSTPNTLELNTPQELLAYLQTLAIEVNLYAILAALAEHYQREEFYGWQIVREVVENCLANIPLPDRIADQTRNILLEETKWPFKQLLTPMLGAKSFGTGMPSAMGYLHNPLLITNSGGYQTCAI